MTILFTAMAIAAQAATASVQPAPPAMHGMQAPQAQRSATGAKPSGDGCACCKDMAGGAKMECCAKHGEGHGAEHSGHSTKH